MYSLLFSFTLGKTVLDNPPFKDLTRIPKLAVDAEWQDNTEKGIRNISMSKDRLL